MSWRYLNWETDEHIDFPSPEDTGAALLLCSDGRILEGELRVMTQGNALPHITFTPRDGSIFDFFDAIAWQRLPARQS